MGVVKLSSFGELVYHLSNGKYFHVKSEFENLAKPQKLQIKICVEKIRISAKWLVHISVSTKLPQTLYVARVCTLFANNL